MSQSGKKRKSLTSEHRNNIRLGLLGIKRSQETKDKISKAHTGKIISQQHRQAISKSQKGISKPKFTQEHCNKISLAKKGTIPWNKGKTGVYSKETLESMGVANRGRPSPLKGKSPSEKTRQLMREAKIGSVPWNKGTKGLQISWCKGLTKETDERLQRISEKQKGKQISEKSRKLMSLAKKGKPSPKRGIPSGKKGQVKNPELRIKRWFAKLPMRFEGGKVEWWVSWKKSGKRNSFYGKKHSEETHVKFAQRKWGPYKDSKPEKMMQIALALNGISFIKHKPIKLGKRWHQVDIFIEPNICVEIDGVYYHMNEEHIKRDIWKSQELTILGYHLIRIRDKDIEKNTQNCAEKVIQLIKELQHRHIPLD